jgi:hypothetical protein
MLLRTAKNNTKVVGLFQTTTYSNSNNRVMMMNATQRMLLSSAPTEQPMSLGKGAKSGVVPSDDDQATGREREVSN